MAHDGDSPAHDEKLIDTERDYLLRYVVSSLALAGVNVSYEDASRILDDVDKENELNDCE